MYLRALLITSLMTFSVCADEAISGIHAMLVEPVCSMNEQGQFLIAWNSEGTLGGDVIYVVRSSPKASLTPPKKIEGLISSSQYVAAALNNKEEGLIVWNTVTGNIQYSIYDSSSQTMQPAKTISGATPYSNQPILAMNDAGDAIALWSDAHQKVQYAIYHRVDHGFSQAQIMLSAKTQQPLVLALNGNEGAIAVWYDSTKQLLSYATYDSTTDRFKRPQTIPDTRDAQNPTLALNDRGEALLAWNTGSFTTPAGFLNYAVYDKESSTFSPLRMITTTQEGLAQNMLPTLALNAKGEGVLLWTQLTAKGRESMRYAFYNKGTKKFDKPKTLAGVLPYSTAPQVVMNTRGEIVATWISTQTGTIQYSSYNKTAKSFSPVYTLSEQNTAQAPFPQILFNDAGEGIMLWSVLGKIQYSFYQKNKQFGEIESIILN